MMEMFKYLTGGGVKGTGISAVDARNLLWGKMRNRGRGSLGRHLPQGTDSR